MNGEEATMLDALIPTPRLVEVDRIEVAAPPEEVWQALRHGNLAEAPLIRALFKRALAKELRRRGQAALWGAAFAGAGAAARSGCERCPHG